VELDNVQFGSVFADSRLILIRIGSYIQPKGIPLVYAILEKRAANIRSEPVSSGVKGL